jgi:hypothetical protein
MRSSERHEPHVLVTVEQSCLLSDAQLGASRQLTEEERREEEDTVRYCCRPSRSPAAKSSESSEEIAEALASAGAGVTWMRKAEEDKAPKES